MLRLLDLREDKDLNQTDIAKILNIDRSQYSKLELDICKITSDKLITLSKYYNTSTDYILGLTNTMTTYKKNEKDINLKLKYLRKLKKLKSIDIANLLNISQPQYSSIENGKFRLTHDKLITLAYFYETSVDYILGLTNESKPYPKPPFEIK